MLLEDKVAVVTAGGSGMGRASAMLMAAHGAHVVVSDRDPEAAQQVASEIETAGGHAAWRKLDVTSRDDFEALLDFIDDTHGCIDVLHNHAGAPGPVGLDVSDEAFDRNIAINAKSAFYGTTLALPLLRKSRGTASVIFTASAMGLVASPGSPLYSLTKGGVIAMARSLAIALAPDVRVNAVAPGVVETPMLAEFFGGDSKTGYRDKVQSWAENQIPMGRTARPEEIAGAVLFLASDLSSFMTGVTLPVDGGYTAK